MVSFNGSGVMENKAKSVGKVTGGGVGGIISHIFPHPSNPSSWKIDMALVSTLQRKSDDATLYYALTSSSSSSKTYVHTGATLGEIKA